MGWRSVLQRLLPMYGMLDKKTVEWSEFLAGQVLAAAQWFVPDGHGLWVWRACCYCQRHNDKTRLGSGGEQDSSDNQVQDGLVAEQSKENDNNAEGAEDEALRDLSKSEGWLWNLGYWKVWKAAFKEITERVDDVRVREVVRSEASKALKVMEESETL
jgi:hypothetical protein